MAISFAKKGVGALKTTSQPATSAAPASKPSSHSSLSKGSFLKFGASAKAAMAQEQAKSDLAKQEFGKLLRFFMDQDAERKITFLDGEVDDDGMLDVLCYYEHTVNVAGKWQNFACTSEQEGYCPICAHGDSKSTLVWALTVIDHTPYKHDNGKVYVNQRKLFIAKKETVKLLSKIAVKRGGLTGCTFDASRIGEKAARVGTQFDFVEKQSFAEIAKMYSLKEEEVVPADYAEEIVYRTGDQLVELGLGKAMTGPGTEKSTVSKKDLQNEL